MTEERPYEPPCVANYRALAKSQVSGRRRKNRLTVAAVLLIGAVFISIPTVVPPGDWGRDLVAIGMIIEGLICLFVGLLR